MDEKSEIMEVQESSEVIELVPEEKPPLDKWLQLLFYAALASTLLSFLSAFVKVGTVLGLINKIPAIMAVIGLFQMGNINKRYKTAAILQCVVVGCSIFSVLSLPASICSLVAQWMEYSGHSELTQEPDPALSRRWHRLFYIQLALGLVIGLSTVIAAVVATLIGAMVTQAVVTIIALSGSAVNIFYVLYLYKTKKLFI